MSTGHPCGRHPVWNGHDWDKGGGVLNGIELEILWNRLIAITDEMAATLTRTSHSTLVREGNDFACVVLDARGRALAQSTRSIPSFTVLLPRTVKTMLEVYPPTQWQPGDVVVTNDPWVANGHLPDLTMVVPVFDRGRLLGFVGTVAHLPDIGGRQLSGAATDLYEEGLRIPITRLYTAGQPNHELLKLVQANVRVPDQVLGDLRAQVITNRLGIGRVIDLVRDAGLPSLDSVAARIQELAEQSFRRAIATVPPGEYTAEVVGDGFDEPVTVRARIEVKSDSVHVDFGGSSRESGRANNVPLSYTFAYTVYALKCILDPHTPNNEGCFRPVTISAPDGCIVNARPPAAVSGRHTVGHLVPSVVFRALAPVLPDRVPAESGTPLWAFCFGGVKDGRRFSIFPSFNGGQGASVHRDGLPCLSFPSNSANTPVEVIEALTTLRVVEKRLQPDSGGPGAHRGGLGQRVVFRATAPEPVKVSMFSDKIAYPAFGIAGGGSGGHGAVLLNGLPVPYPKGEILLRTGDELTLVLPGGGGHGDPSLRPPALIASDQKNGYVTAAGSADRPSHLEGG